MLDISFILAVFLIVAAGIAIAVFYIKRKTNDASLGLIQQGLQQGLEAIRGEIKESREKNIESLENQLKEGRAYSEKQLQESRQIVKDVTERLTRLDETNKQVIGFAEQLQSLENILKNPKQRGILGEYSLKILLESAFTPKQFQMQYAFNDGQIVDAALFIGDKIIPIDSKFSLENYNRLVEERNETERARLEKLFVADLKLRIQETAKYIQPSQGTMDFAFMFIPHEAIYYDLIVNKIGALKDEDTENLIQRAAGKHKVIIVSPTSFLAYLQTVLQGLRALQIEESAKEIRERVEQLGKHLLAYDEYFKKLGNNLGTTVNSYNAAYKELNKIDKDVVKITDGENRIEPLQIDKPNN